VVNVPEYLKPEIKRLDAQIAKARELLSDPQLKALAEEEIKTLENQKQELLTPSKEPETESSDDKERQGSVIVEVRSAAGGAEAKLWAKDILSMYTRFANSLKLPVEILDEGAIKIKGKKAYSLFQFEAGVHRVQRVPDTEASGRIHTSTATVAVLPEVKETEVNIHPNDLEIQFTHSSSQGGQNVQKVSTAVRLIHKPTGIVVNAQTQRFQEQNRKLAMEMLRSKLYQLEEEKRLAALGAARSVIGRGMRAEKIRTYNFPQNRVTDHRINTSWKALDRIMAGDLLPVIEKLQSALQSE